MQTLISASIFLDAYDPRSKICGFAMSGADKASVSKYPIWHHNMTVRRRDIDRARYPRQLFSISYLALSQRSFRAFSSSQFSFFKILAASLRSSVHVFRGFANTEIT